MKRKELYKVINEEISEFDFLGMTSVKDEFEHNNLLNSKEFQTNLIKDIITNISDSNKIKNFSSTFVNKEIDMNNDNESIELEIELTYNYKETNYDLIIFIDGDKENDNINLENFDMKLFSKAGDQIKMEWVEKNKELYKRLIESLITPFID
jgi:hypothetical protein